MNLRQIFTTYTILNICFIIPYSIFELPHYKIIIDIATIIWLSLLFIVIPFILIVFGKKHDALHAVSEVEEKK